MDDISHSSFLITAVWIQSEEAPRGDEDYLKRCHEGSITKLRGVTLSGKEKAIFHLDYHRPQWCVNLISMLNTKGLLNINPTDKQTT